MPVVDGPWSERKFDQGGNPPDNPGMDARVAKMEAVIPTLATREDLARLEAKMHQEFTAQTWKLITWVTGACTALTAVTYFIARLPK